MTTVDYPRARDLSARALERGGLKLEDVVRAYRVLAVASSQLDDEQHADPAFLRLLALDPGSNVASRLAPARRNAMMNAQGFWAVHKDGFGIDVGYGRRERQVSVSVRDPLGWAKKLHVWTRFGDRPYVKAERPVGTDLTIDVDDIGPTEPLEVYVYAVDEHGNVISQFGKEREPRVFALSEEEMSALMRRDVRGGQTGSYARRLEELGVQVGVHGYLSLEFKPVNDVPSFDLHHATAMIRASLQRAVSLELALEWEHLGPETGEFYIPHAFLDLKVVDPLVLRIGFFEAPIGAFNEYLYPDFLRITGQAPLFAESVVPALWSEVGVQARGRVPLGSPVALTYAVFLSNGLEQEDAMPGDGVVAEGGPIDEMRFNARDRYHADKAVGGRLGLEIGDFDLGASAYTGRYTIDANRRLSIGDADLSFRNKWLTVRSEAAAAYEQVTSRVLRKYGGYALLAGRPSGYIEPYTQYDYVKVGTQTQRVLVGVALYPFPNERATRNLRLKSEGGYEFPKGAKRQFVWFFQVTTGF